MLNTNLIKKACRIPSLLNANFFYAKVPPALKEISNILKW